MRESEEAFNTEGYSALVENDFLRTEHNPLSTFSIDVDTASYANVRRFLNASQLPPPGAVRIEELVNYFPYAYPPPSDGAPFAVQAEVARCPWQPAHQLLRIGIKGKVIARDKRPPSNLVFLIDVSGSMDQPNKLPLVKECLKLLLQELTANDRVALCVYAGGSGLVLPSTTADQKAKITAAINRLSAGGSTNGGQGIQLAYQTAVENFLEGGTNRVILCTDGDFNVGVTSHDELLRLITQQAKSKVFLSVLGFGCGDYQDSTLELLADKGNGNYGYIDTRNEGHKIFKEQLEGTLITIAKDVKIQVDFNPEQVAAYRLLGYENRLLKAEDFLDDRKDAGEIGAGHTVTAVYEIVPPGVEVPAGRIEPSKYVPMNERTADIKRAEHAGELLTVRLRYKEQEGEESRPLEVAVPASIHELEQTSSDMQFATAVVQFGLLLRKSQYAGDAQWAAVLETAQANLGPDPFGYRAEFCSLVKKAQGLIAKK